MQYLYHYVHVLSKCISGYSNSNCYLPRITPTCKKKTYTFKNGISGEIISQECPSGYINSGCSNQCLSQVLIGIFELIDVMFRSHSFLNWLTQQKYRNAIFFFQRHSGMPKVMLFDFIESLILIKYHLQTNINIIIILLIVAHGNINVCYFHNFPSYSVSTR